MMSKHDLPPSLPPGAPAPSFPVPGPGDGAAWRRFYAELLAFPAQDDPDRVLGIELSWASPRPFEGSLPTATGDDGMPVVQVTPFQSVDFFVRGRTRHGHRPFDQDPAVTVAPEEAGSVTLVDHATGGFQFAPSRSTSYRGAVGITVEAVLNGGTDSERRFTRVGTVMLADEPIQDLEDLEFGDPVDAPDQPVG
jgi:hypothetical protein